MDQRLAVKPPRVRAQRKARGAFHHGDLREAAIEVPVGHERLSLTGIAGRLGVSAPALYRHFEDRRSLLSEVGQRGFIRFEAAITSVVEQEASAWDKILALGRRYIDFALQNPGWFRLQFLSSPDDRTSPDLTRTPARYRDRWFSSFKAEVGADDDLASEVYFAVWATAHGLAVLLTERVFPADSPAVRARKVERPLVPCVLGLKALAAERRAKLG